MLHTEFKGHGDKQKLQVEARIRKIQQEGDNSSQAVRASQGGQSPSIVGGTNWNNDRKYTY